MITVNKGTDIRDVRLDYGDCIDFVNRYAIKAQRNNVLMALEKYGESADGMIPAHNFNTLMLNWDAIKPSVTLILRKFLVDNGVDYQMVSNAFGWGEEMMVLFNMRQIENIQVVKSGDKITEYDLSTEWN